MPMTPRAGLQVAKELADFIESEALQGLAIEAGAFWAGAAAVFARFAPENRRLLTVRDDLQGRIDDWHRQRRGQPHDAAATESSRSTMVDSAASSTTSAMPDGSSRPIGWSRLNTTSMCRPLWRKTRPWSVAPTY